MDDTKLHQSVASGEAAAIATAEPPLETAAPQAPTEQATPDESSCCVGNAHVPPRQPGVYAPVTVDLPSNTASQLNDFAVFMKRTWHIWAIAVGAVLGLYLTITALQSFRDKVQAAQLKRYDRASASVTPDRLIARCGQAAEDVTKEVFPVVMRTIKYKPWVGEPLVFTFSRTAEQQSDWVFLTMKNEAGTKSFDTPESKIMAFSCLDSTK